jgi:hypothetical protein
LSQNTSSAVMQQRIEAHDSLDDFPTPPWATRALCERIIVGGMWSSCREPAANRGHMVKPLLEYFSTVDASDIHDYGAGFPVRDYLFGPCEPVDWTITNPPFRLAEQFIKKALTESRCGIAVIVRSAFLESVGRYEHLFAVRPPSHVLQFLSVSSCTRASCPRKAARQQPIAGLCGARTMLAQHNLTGLRRAGSALSAKGITHENLRRLQALSTIPPLR